MSNIPFIDIAVHDAVREAMLDGRAAVVFDRFIEKVIWANGRAAGMFGYSAIGDLLIAGISSFGTTLRQIKSAAERNPRTSRAMLLRVAAGMKSHLHNAHIQIVEINEASEELVLVVFERDQQDTVDANLAEDAIAGLEEDGAGAAILDGDGALIASGQQFGSLDIPSAALTDLCAEVADEDDRLVKKLISRGTGKTKVAVGIGRLSEEPARNLIVAMNTEIEEQTAPVKQSLPIVPTPNAPEVRTIKAPPLVSDNDDKEDFDDDQEIDDDEPQEQIDLSKRPVRFVWKTDADGRFIEVSEEFPQAVGAGAADIIGHKVREILEKFRLDASDEINHSMEQRDTWSGKTVMWPIEGTDLRAPVDLAALPYYNREREFEGYRGFGIVRVSDAVIDPLELGLSLKSSNASSEQAIEPIASQEPDVKIDDPFEGEPPALQTSSITPLRREADHEKIVPLEEHRVERARIEAINALNENEAEAFKKIGQALNNKTASSDEIPEIENTIDDDPENSDDYEVQDELAAAEEVIDEAPELPTTGQIEDEPENSDLRDEWDDIEGSNQASLGPAELDALPLSLLVVRDEDALFGNEAFARMSGYNDVESLNERGLSALFGEDTSALEDAPQSAYRPLTLIDANGEEIVARAHLQLVPWLGKTALMFAFEPHASSTEDEEGEPETEPLADDSDSLRSAAFDEVAEMRAILDTATDGVVVISQDGTIRSLNSSASALFGYTDQDVTGKSFSILFANESQRAAMDYLNGFSNNSVASLLNEGREVLARERNGGFLPVFMTIGKLPTSNGYCAVMRDITPWKQTELALQEAKQDAEDASNTKSDFLAKVSHEIRTPLNAIIGFSELMREERFGPIGNERYKDYLVDINKSGRHVLDLVNDLLDISKIEAGEQELEFEGVFLTEAVADAISMIQPQANRNRIIVRSSLESDLPSVVADARSIKQIVLNLLSNAIRFTNPGGQVVVSTNYTARGSVVLRIRDTGIGMTNKEMETALRPFQQVATDEVEQSEGTGLGLPLTKALVEANRAEFNIASEPGRGTTIEIVFPPARVLAD